MALLFLVVLVVSINAHPTSQNQSTTTRVKTDSVQAETTLFSLSSLSSDSFRQYSVLSEDLNGDHTSTSTIDIAHPSRASHSTTLPSARSLTSATSEASEEFSSPTLYYDPQIITSTQASITSEPLLLTPPATSPATSTSSTISDDPFNNSYTLVSSSASSPTATFASANDATSTAPSKSVISVLIVFAILASSIITTVIWRKCRAYAKLKRERELEDNLALFNQPDMYISDPFPPGGRPKSRFGIGSKYPRASRFRPQLPSAVQAEEKQKTQVDVWPWVQ